MFPRVVVTGIGMVSCLGKTAEETWQGLLSGKSGIRSIDDFGIEGFVGGRLPYEIDLEDLYPDERLRKRVGRLGAFFVHLGVKAAREALENSGYFRERFSEVGIVLGSGVGGIVEQINGVISFEKKKQNMYLQPLLSAGVGALVAGVSIGLGIQGPSYGVQNACSSAGSAIAAAFDMIRSGRAKAVLTGGAEAPTNDFIGRSILGYRLYPVGYEKNPQEASRPFDKDRKGMIPSDGASILLLEEYESARARGAKIISEIVGVGMTSDACDFVSPPEDGVPLENSIRGALQESNLSPQDVDFVTAHATGSIIGDNVESKVLHRIYKDCGKIPPIYACKSAMGHTFGASVAFEAAIATKSIECSVVPPNINLVELSPENPLSIEDFPLQKISKDIKVAVTQGFGFGGVNVCIIQKKYQET